MDPILLPKLLDVVNEVDKIRSAPDSNTLSVRLGFGIRRTRDALRILSEAGLLKITADGVNQTARFHSLISAWDGAETDHMSEILTAYGPYCRFLLCIKENSELPIPSRDARSEFGDWLYTRYGITFVAFDTFWRWAQVLGMIYRGYSARSVVCWGGERPALAEFASAVKESWRARKASDGFAGVSAIAEDVCRSLHISFRFLESLFGDMMMRYPGNLIMVSTALRPISRRREVQVLVPRKEALERSSASGHRIDWVHRRFMEDGILIGKHYMRLMRWEE